MVTVPQQDGKKQYDSASVMPYRSIVMKCILDVVRSAEEHKPCNVESKILLKILPSAWVKEIQPKLDTLKHSSESKIGTAEKELQKMRFQTSRNSESYLIKEDDIRQMKADMALGIVQIVIDLLDDKKILLYEETRPREIGWGADFEGESKEYL